MPWVALEDVIRGCAAIGVDVFVDMNGVLTFSTDPPRRYEADPWSGHVLTLARLPRGWRAFVDHAGLPGHHIVSRAAHLACEAVGAPLSLRWYRRS